jgi:hypothetical protein
MSNRPGIGARALHYIAEQLKGNDQLLTEHGDVPYSLELDEKSYPLGRYLRDRLRDLCELDEMVTEHGEVLYVGKEKEKETRVKEMLDMWKDAVNDPKASKDAMASLRHFLTDSTAQETLNFETKQKLFQKEKQL